MSAVDILLSKGTHVSHHEFPSPEPMHGYQTLISFVLKELCSLASYHTWLWWWRNLSSGPGGWGGERPRGVETQRPPLPSECRSCPNQRPHMSSAFQLAGKGEKLLDCIFKIWLVFHICMEACCYLTGHLIFHLFIFPLTDSSMAIQYVHNAEKNNYRKGTQRMS